MSIDRVTDPLRLASEVAFGLAFGLAPDLTIASLRVSPSTWGAAPAEGVEAWKECDKIQFLF
jgi:hypothetical protein